MKVAFISPWRFLEDSQGMGDKSLIHAELTAFFASRQCPGSAIRATMDWAMEQTHRRTPLIGGFQSPLEQSVLELALAAKSPVVIVITRSLDRARIPPRWRTGLQAGNMAVISMANARLTAALAQRRNHWIGCHARHIVVGHANPTGDLAQLIELWRQEERSVELLSQPPKT